MKQEAAHRSSNTWLIRTAVLMILLAGSSSPRPVLADPTGPQALDLRMTMASSTRISLGEPIVVHYTIKNMAPAEQITFHAGEKNNEWYAFSLTDSKGRTIKAVPPPTLGTTQGLHQSPEASIPHGDRMEGDLVVTRYLAVPGPGTYTLVVHTATPYYVEPSDAGWYPNGRPSSMQLVELRQDFRFPLIVTATTSAALRVLSEALRRKLADARYAGQWKSLTEQLFSLPEEEAFSAWQTLLTDPTTSDLVLTTAADQLASQPDVTKASLLAEALWGGVQLMDNDAHPGLWKALLKMYGTPDPVLKQRIHSLYNMHGISDARILEAQTASHPN